MIVLAQVDSGELNGFMEQPFVGPVLGMLCVVSLLLVAVIGTLLYLRRRNTRIAQQNQVAPPSFISDDMGSEMPDLDVLVNTAGLTQPIPAAPPPAPPRAARKGTFLVAVNDGDATEAVEVMTILRDVVDGGLIVQMGDKAYQRVNNDQDFQERFNKVMRELAQVVAKPAASREAVSAPSAESAASEPEESMSAANPEPPAASLADLMQPDEQPAPRPPRPKPPAPPPASVPSGALPGDLPSFKLDDNPLEKRRRGQRNEPKPVPEVNIAGAIEAYLQYKLRNTPDFQGHSIHIYPAPDGGVSIEVDGRYYDAVGDIQDNEVREFIAAAIQEWQERH
jgi:hypothetical protein